MSKESPSVNEATSPKSESGSASNDFEQREEREFIYHQTTEKENALFYRLDEGFQKLRDLRSDKRSLQGSSHGAGDGSDSGRSYQVHHLSSRVTVNFIDPTTKVHSPRANNMMSQQQQQQQQQQNSISNVYEKLTTLLERDYGSTLRSVQYKNMRSGENDVISTIPIQPVLTRAGGGGATPTVSTPSGDVPWGGTAGMAPVGDPSEWHLAPFCHVYIAACESLEHYRTKIRPSLQAFVSQIENSSSSGGSNSAHYLIVYVPTGQEAAAGIRSASNTFDEQDTTQGSGPVRRALANRFQAARQRIADYRGSEEMDNYSSHSKDSATSDGLARGESTEDDDGAVTGALALLTKPQRELYKKIAADFAKGKVCVLSTSSLDTKIDAASSGDATEFAARTQEWNFFNRLLGSVIVDGFRDRCRRYNEELRRLDAQRAAAATASKSSLAERSKNPSAVFNISYFFLVKESLAFTYEQMGLPSEALMQYDEFRAFLPDLNLRDAKKAKKARRKSKALAENSPSLVQLADAGDYINFRKRIRSEFDLTPIVDIVKRYLFVREMSLLFLLGQPVELIARCEAFSKLMYSIMMRDFPEMSQQDQSARKVEAAKWVIQFTWDIKTTCESYLSSVYDDMRSVNDTISVATYGSDDEDIEATTSDVAVASKLGELLETSRLLFMILGDTELSGVTKNPLRHFEGITPKDMLRTWQQWAPMENRDTDDTRDIVSPVSKSITDRSFLLEGAFDSVEAYEQVYLKLAGALVTLSRHGNRKRLASRVQGEIAEYHIRRGELHHAISILKVIIKLYKADQWDRCHFFRLFRLAYCQRTASDPTDYLKTLVTCFTPRTAVAGPESALHKLQDDLEVIMGHPSVGQAKYGRLSFIETELRVLETSSDRASVGTGVDKKQILKRYCSVGEKLTILVTVASHLPRKITLSSVKLFIVAFAEFSSILENRESVEEEDAFRTIALGSEVTLHPGKNTFTMEWEPTSSGQFVLSTIELKWKEGFFYYDSMDLPAPLSGVDVLPSEPTHSLSFEPKYLVPGQDQELHLKFEAGSDAITSGKIVFSCSDGISLIPPGGDPASGGWKTSCEVELGDQKPGASLSFTVVVRSGVTEAFSNDAIAQVPSVDTTHGLSIKVFTTYLHTEIEGTNVGDVPSMKNSVELFTPILEKTALSVEAVATTWNSPEESALVSIELLSNTPDHFVIEDWRLLLPPPMKLKEDMNNDLKKCAVSDGDTVSFAFDCCIDKDGSTSNDVSDAELQVHLLDDAKKQFTLTLPLDMNDFYLKLLNSNNTAPHEEASAELVIDSEEGPVGEPIVLTYRVDSNQAGKQGLVYSVDAEGSEWLLGGKISGALNDSGSCEIISIPAVPGVLTRFPSIKICAEDWTRPIHVKCRFPEKFRSLSMLDATGIAFPTSAQV